jgi:hypothetical protein
MWWVPRELARRYWPLDEPELLVTYLIVRPCPTNIQQKKYANPSQTITSTDLVFKDSRFVFLDDSN